MKGRLSDNFVMPMTLVNAPPVQQMNSGQDNQDSSSAAPSSSANGHEHHTNLEMQPIWEHYLALKPYIYEVIFAHKIKLVVYVLFIHAW